MRGDGNIWRVAVSYFNNMFTSSRAATTEYTSIFDEYEPRVTAAMNTDLTKEVTEEEIRNAVFTIGADKAPGPDGITAAFFQQFWPDIKDDIIREVRKFFDRG